MVLEWKTYILECMGKTETFEYTRRVLSDLQDDLENEILRLEKETCSTNPLLRLLIVGLGIRSST